MPQEEPHGLLTEYNLQGIAHLLCMLPLAVHEHCYEGGFERVAWAEDVKFKVDTYLTLTAGSEFGLPRSGAHVEQNEMSHQVLVQLSTLDENDNMKMLVDDEPVLHSDSSKPGFDCVHVRRDGSIQASKHFDTTGDRAKAFLEWLQSDDVPVGDLVCVAAMGDATNGAPDDAYKALDLLGSRAFEDEATRRGDESTRIANVPNACYALVSRRGALEPLFERLVREDAMRGYEFKVRVHRPREEEEAAVNERGMALLLGRKLAKWMNEVSLEALVAEWREKPRNEWLDDCCAVTCFRRLAQLIRRAERALSYWHQPAAWHSQRERWQASLATYEGGSSEVVPSLSVAQLDEASKKKLEGNMLLPTHLLADWQLVRRVKAGDKWHAATDKLGGTAAQYGGVFRSEAVTESFGMPFAHEEYDQFLFSTGNGKHWLIVDSKEVEAHAQGKASGPRTVYASSKSLSPSEVDWKGSLPLEGDPNTFYISIDNFDQARNAGGEMLYGENCSAFYLKWQFNNQGCNVWVRRQPTEAEKHALRRSMSVLKQPMLDEALLVPWETGQFRGETVKGTRRRPQTRTTRQSGCSNENPTTLH